MLKTISAFSLFLLIAGAVHAEDQRVEAVGIYGIRDATRRKVIPRDEALGRGLWEGVSRVALELIGESSVGLDASGPGESGDLGDSSDPDRIVSPIDGVGEERGSDARVGREAPTRGEVELLESALGKDVRPYTRSFRILKDQGEVPALFAEDPAIKTEYVVVVEVIVDVDRVTRALEQAGLVTAAAPAMAGERVRLEIVGFASHEPIFKTVDTLRKRFGATHVDFIEFRRSVQVMYVRGPFGAQGLADRLARTRTAGLGFDAIFVDPDTQLVRARGHWSPESVPK